MTRGRRSILTYVSGTALTATTMVVGLIAVPFIVRWLGDESYGAFRAGVDWFGYLTLLELGLAGALLPLLAGAMGRHDSGAVARTLAAGVRAYAHVTGVMILVGVLMVAVITRLIPVSEANTADLVRASLVAVIGVLLTPFIPFRSIAEARQRGYLVNMLMLLQSLIVTGTSLWLAYRGWGITGQFVALFTGSIVFYAILTMREGGRLRDFTAARVAGAPRTPEWEKLWALNRPTLIRQICGRVSFTSDHIIVALMLGPAAVVPLYLTRRLADLAQGQLQGVGNASWAALADLHAAGDRVTFANRLMEATKFVSALGVAVLVPIAVYNQEFVNLWIGPRQFAGTAISVVVAANAFLLGVLTLWDWAFGCTGNVAKLVPVSVVAAVINIVVSIALTLKLGLIGPLIGTLAATVLTSGWYVPILLKRTFDVSLAALARAVAVPLGFGIPYAAALWRIANSSPDLGWFGLATQMGLAVVAYMIVWWIFILNRSERAMYKGRLRSLRGGAVS